MVVDQRALHEVLKTKEWISVIKNKIVLGRALWVNLFRNPMKAMTRIGNQLQILTGVGRAQLRFESREHFRTITEIFGSFE